jgi:hypothetical protein
MPRRHFTPQELQKIRELAAGWGKIITRQAFGDQGPDLDVDFAAMEQLATAAAQGLTEGTLTSLLEQHAQRLGEQQPCPDCGRLCVVRREPRDLHVRGGPLLRQSEPLCHCPDCRRDFFPPKAPATSGRSRLQPRRAADDR